MKELTKKERKQMHAEAFAVLEEAGLKSPDIPHKAFHMESKVYVLLGIPYEEWKSSSAETTLRIRRSARVTNGVVTGLWLFVESQGLLDGVYLRRGENWVQLDEGTGCYNRPVTSDCADWLEAMAKVYDWA